MTMADRIALVSGASSGIGRAIASALLTAGARVVLAGRNMAALEQTAAGHGSRAHVLRLDVTDYAAVDALTESLPAEFRNLDLLVNNAGHDVGGRTPFDQGRAEDWTSIIETNVSGLMR